MWRKIIPAVAVIILLAGPAYSQSMNLIPMPGDQRKSPEELQRERAIEQDYNAAASRIPDKKPSSNDPWGSVRSAPSKSSSTSKQRSQ
jgi:hypothetical protein